MEEKSKKLISNEEYNFIKKRMQYLEGAYKQSTDNLVRNAVKDSVLYEIGERIPDFYSEYSSLFSTCKMSSLKEILDLYYMIMNSYEIISFPKVENSNDIKRIIKLKDNNLKSFIRGYNEAVDKNSLSYYSQIIDDKLVILTYCDGEFIGTVTDMTKRAKNGECLCFVCNRFRKGNEISFISNVSKKSNGEYSSIGQTICTDYVTCNKEIEDTDKLVKFLKYSSKGRK